jgi:hypothetical protein
MAAKLEMIVARALLKLVNKNIIMDEQTYINSSTKCRFYEDPYGEFWTKPTLLINGKQIGHPKARYIRVANTLKNRTHNNHKYDKNKLFQRITTKFIDIKIYEDTYINTQKKNEIRIKREGDLEYAI